MTKLRDFYPEIDAYNEGMLDVGDGHQIYYSESGNKKGIPVVHLHGGPGGCSKPKHKRFFNPKKYRIILFDQRGCGRSTPFASLKKNTTAHLVADMEKLRAHLNVKKWVVFGGSWGSTLGLAYIAAHAKNVIAAVMNGIWLGRASETYEMVGTDGIAAQMFPEAYEEFLSLLTPRERKNPLRSYAKLIADVKNKRYKKAARAWCTWETTLYLLGASSPQEIKAGMDELEKSGAMRSTALFETHYMKNECFIDADKIPARLKKCDRVPSFIFQGRVDFVCPPQTAWDVHKAWKNSKLMFIEGEGHSNSGPKMLDALIRATDMITKNLSPKK